MRIAKDILVLIKLIVLSFFKRSVQMFGIWFFHALFNRNSELFFLVYCMQIVLFAAQTFMIEVVSVILPIILYWMCGMSFVWKLARFIIPSACVISIEVRVKLINLMMISIWAFRAAVFE